MCQTRKYWPPHCRFAPSLIDSNYYAVASIFFHLFFSWLLLHTVRSVFLSFNRSYTLFSPILLITIIIILFRKLIHKFLDISIFADKLICVMHFHIQYHIIFSCSLSLSLAKFTPTNLPNNRLKTMKITSVPTQIMHIEPNPWQQEKKTKANENSTVSE